MNLTDFVHDLEQELRLAGVAFDLRDLEIWAAAVWPLARDEADVGRWALAFRVAELGDEVSPLATMGRGPY